MADIMKLAPIILKWEAGARFETIDSTGRKCVVPLDRQWEYAVKKGYSNKPSDAGGPTFCGVTLKTYSSYCKKKGKQSPSVYDLRRITFETWIDILRVFWDKMRADEIQNQSVANLCVDNVWMSGPAYIKQIQSVLDVATDGIAGSETIAAINGRNQRELFGKLVEKRRIFYLNLIMANPRNKPNGNGWMNRLADFKFEEGGAR